MERKRRGGSMGDGTAEPLRFPGAPPSVLALHGFGGTPQEVELVAREAEKLGLRAVAPLLPGHGSTVAALAALRFKDWLEAAEAEYLALAAEGPVIVSGLSMGAVVALTLAARYPETTLGVAALANAVWLRSPWPALGLALVVKLRLPDFSFPKNAPDIADPLVRARHLTYDAQPVLAAASLLHAGEALLQELHQIRCSALILHGALDAVCPVSNAWRLRMQLGSTDVRLRVLPRSKHIITRDVERDVVAEEVAAFLQHCRSRSLAR